MKIGIVFWGITRSLKYTIESINNNIFDVLKSNGIDYEVCMHNYSLSSSYTNYRANEHNIQLDNDEYILLNPTHLLIDSQEKVLSQLNVSNYKRQRDPWGNKYQSLEFYVLSMYSKNKITQYLADNKIKYDKLLFIRPDVSYKTKFNVNWLYNINNNDLFIPDHGLYNGYSDRMALCNYEIGIVYGTLFKYLLNYSKIKPLHSETVEKEILLSIINGLKIKYIKFDFNRVRANGVELNDSNTTAN
jgi:hypothetical protein